MLGSGAAKLANVAAMASALLGAARETPAAPVIGADDMRRLTDPSGRQSLADAEPLAAIRRGADALATMTLALGWQWSVSLEDWSGAASAGGMPDSAAVNVLCRSVSFGSRTITGDPQAVASAQWDRVTAAQGTQIRMTTLDTEDELLRRWFEGRADRVARPDGTFGLPVDYAVVVTIRQLSGAGASTGEARQFLVRPATIEEEMSREAMDMKLLTLVFDPMDTFLAP